MDEKIFSQRKALPDEELICVSGGTSENEGSVTVVIRDLSGHETTFTVNPDKTIAELKVLYRERTGCPVAWMRFICKGTQLDDSGTLASYNFSDYGVIHFAHHECN